MRKEELLQLVNAISHAGERCSSEEAKGYCLSQIRTLVGNLSSSDFISKEEFKLYLGSQDRVHVVKAFRERTGCSLAEACEMFPPRNPKL